MELDQQAKRELEDVVRGLSAATKALRLYPATSPMPRQAVEVAENALATYLATYPELSLSVSRDGLTFDGQPVAPGSPGVTDLAEDLRSHGVKDIGFVPGVSAEDILGFLGVVMRDVAETRDQGGVSAILTTAGIVGITASDVQLVVVEEEDLAPEGDIDEFFRQLAGDAEKLAAWLAQVARRDPSALSDGLAELAAASGPDGLAELARNLAEAFSAQDATGKDAVFGAAMSPGIQQDVVGRALESLATGDLASALTDGLYGRNMLSLSNAMSELPFGDRLAKIMEEVQRSLPEIGHSVKEAEFLEHMMHVHAMTEPEPSLVEVDQTYKTVAKLADVTPEETERALSETEGARAFASAVATILAFLDQEEELELYQRSLESLSALVPRLVEEGDLDLAAQVLEELHAREERSTKPWPELDGMIRSAITTATGRRTMEAVLQAVTSDPDALEAARTIVQRSGDGADIALAEEALALKGPGLAAAEDLVGRRIVNLFAAAAPGLPWHQIGPVVKRLSTESDPRSVEAVRMLASRPDEQSRRETAAALAEGGANAVAPLADLARDPNEEVAVTAARSLAKIGGAEGAAALATRLGELDVDGKDFMLAREVIGALARVEHPAAGDAIKALVDRKALIKRGHFAEIQQLAQQADAYRKKRGEGS